MRLSRASAYALGAVLQLADAPPGVPVPCSHLARQGQMPERFLLQVLRNLVTQGILTSTRGVDGGYSLARPLDEISLLQILEATDGPQVANVPPLDALPTTFRSKLQKVLEQVAAATAGRLAQVKLSSFYTKRLEAGPGEIAARR
jgi:Rrf2 family protein